MDRLKKFYINGILMTGVALAARYISVRFNIYIASKIGEVAMGLFTLISSVYGFALTLATSGISLATTKLVSEAMGTAQAKDRFDISSTVGSIMKKSILFSLSVSSAVAFLLFVLSDFLGTYVLGDVRTVSSLKILAASLPPIALSSSLTGYFTARRNVYKNALASVLAQGLRISLCVILLGSIIADDMESACVAIVLGGTISELATFLFQLTLYLKERLAEKRKSKYSMPDKIFANKLLRITLPVAFSAYMRSALVTVEHLLIPWGLERSGASRDKSLAAYGTVHSLVFPFVLFPSAISASFAGLLVPEISESDAMGDKERIERIITRVLKTVLIYSVGVAGIMMCLSYEFGNILFSGGESAKYIALVAPLVPIMYLDTSVDSILKGLGYQFYSMVINIVDSSLSVILVFILLPRFGIWGYIMTVYFTEIVNATLSITKLLLVTKPKLKIFDIVGKPVLCVICATKAAFALFSAFSFSASNVFALTLAVLCITLLYLAALILCRAISPSKVIKAVTNFIRA